ncbi:MAG: transcription termination factor Rho [Armatimonadetes bacterium]|nr:transcription termination factor Rho [Armatimonadota bacterium]
MRTPRRNDARHSSGPTTRSANPNDRPAGASFRPTPSGGRRAERGERPAHAPDRPPRNPWGRPAGNGAGQAPLTQAEGILDQDARSYYYVRTRADWVPCPADLFVPPALIERAGLRVGHQITVTARPPRAGDRFSSVADVLRIEGRESDARTWQQFERLTAVSPHRRLRLEVSRDEFTTRAIDLLAPMGRGTRGLIVAPPFAGKTRLLSAIARALATNYPELKIFVVLIDERPEEVTEFRRLGVGNVVASSFDSGAESHLQLAELVLHRAQRLVEIGEDVVFLVDSLTRLARTSNLDSKGTGRTLSGGLDAAALRFPRKLLGAARCTEEGGSLTILATTLVDTGSRMDDHIYEEFKGTGNWELHLSRALAERRIFPAIDVPATGTRREELLYTPEELSAVTKLRRHLQVNAGGQEQMALLLKWLEQTKDNSHLLAAAERLVDK